MLRNSLHQVDNSYGQPCCFNDPESAHPDRSQNRTHYKDLPPPLPLDLRHFATTEGTTKVPFRENFVHLGDNV